MCVLSAMSCLDIAVIKYQGYLFDRRQCGRRLREEWGMLLDDKDLTTCICRFGRESNKEDGHEHITGARMANTNGHEVSSIKTLSQNSVIDVR